MLLFSGDSATFWAGILANNRTEFPLKEQGTITAEKELLMSHSRSSRVIVASSRGFRFYGG